LLLKGGVYGTEGRNEVAVPEFVFGGDTRAPIMAGGRSEAFVRLLGEAAAAYQQTVPYLTSRRPTVLVGAGGIDDSVLQQYRRGVEIFCELHPETDPQWIESHFTEAFRQAFLYRVVFIHTLFDLLASPMNFYLWQPGIDTGFDDAGGVRYSLNPLRAHTQTQRLFGYSAGRIVRKRTASTFPEECPDMTTHAWWDITRNHYSCDIPAFPWNLACKVPLAIRAAPIPGTGWNVDMLPDPIAGDENGRIDHFVENAAMLPTITDLVNWESICCMNHPPVTQVIGSIFGIRMGTPEDSDRDFITNRQGVLFAWRIVMNQIQIDSKDIRTFMEAHVK
jgi:hypothetical protein